MNTDTNAFINDLDAGVFESKLAKILSQVAAAVIDNDRKGQVVLTFDFSKIGTSHQVNVSHTLKFKWPTMRGEASETETTATPMHVGQGGRITLFAPNHGQLFDKHGKPNPHMPEQQQLTGDE